MVVPEINSQVPIIGFTGATGISVFLFDSQEMRPARIKIKSDNSFIDFSLFRRKVMNYL
jgi:hypothetical protein